MTYPIDIGSIYLPRVCLDLALDYTPDDGLLFGRPRNRLSDDEIHKACTQREMLIGS